MDRYKMSLSLIVGVFTGSSNKIAYKSQKGKVICDVDIKIIKSISIYKSANLESCIVQMPTEYYFYAKVYPGQ
jgi:hypothetical protein